MKDLPSLTSNESTTSRNIQSEITKLFKSTRIKDYDYFVRMNRLYAELDGDDIVN